MKEGENWYYLNYKKEKQFDSSYFSYASQFIDGYAVVKKEKYGVINQKGETIIPFIYKYLNNCGEGNFEFSSMRNNFYDTQFGIINIKNDTILDNNYSEIFYMDNIAELTIASSGKAGVINTKKNRVIIPFNFTYAEYYEDELSKLEFQDEDGNSFYGYINNRKKIVWSNNYELLEKLLKVN